MSLYDYPPTDENALAAIAVHRRALQGERVTQDLEWAGRTFQACVKPLRDAEGAITGCLGIALDITQRVRAAQERERLLAQVQQQRQRAQELAETLERERDTLQTIMENTYTQLAYLDPQFNFLRVNTAYAQGSGHPRQELIGRNHFELFPNEENQAIFEQVRDTGRPIEFHAKPFEYADQPERGTTYWDWALVPVKDAAGQVLGLVLSLHDVTEQVRAEQAREQHLARLQRLIQVSQEVLAEKTPQGLLQRVVDAARELTGARIGASGWGYRDGAFEASAISQPEDLSPPSPEQMFGIYQGGVHLDLIQREASVRWTDESRLEGTAGAPRAAARAAGRPAGRGGWPGERPGHSLGQGAGRFHARGRSPVGPTGHIGFAGLAAYRGQKRRRAPGTFSAIADGVTIYRPQGEIVRMNPAAERILGYSPQERELPLAERVKALQIRLADSQSLASAEDMPAQRALRGETVRNVLMAIRDSQSDGHRWISVSGPGRERIGGGGLVHRHHRAAPGAG